MPAERAEARPMHRLPTSVPRASRAVRVIAALALVVAAGACQAQRSSSNLAAGRPGPGAELEGGLNGTMGHPHRGSAWNGAAGETPGAAAWDRPGAVQVSGGNPVLPATAATNSCA